jgi:hypothetical protein
MSRVVARVCALTAVLACAGVARSEPSLHEGFETPEVSWRQAGGDARYRIVAHERTTQGPHSGTGCEFVALEASPPGSFVYLSYDVGRAPVIPELTLGVWVRSNRPGLQLAARVVFPRAIDPKTRQPLWTLIVGPKTDQVGRWEQLQIRDLPLVVSRQARVMRSQLRTDVDTHEAYIDHVLLNVYGGPGPTQVWIDDLEATGLVPAAAPPLTLTAVGSEGGPKRVSVKLEGSVLLVDGRPFFPRMIQYQGESLEFLRDRGFNAVHFSEPPSRALLAEAARLQLWVVAPPPRPTGLDGDHPAPLEEFGPELDPVLAWDMGSRLTGRELDTTRRWVEQVRRADSQTARPIICEPDVELRAYSRQVDLLTLRRATLGTSFELSDYSAWLRERCRLARPGTPIWTVVETQLPPVLREQWALLGPSGEVPDVAASCDQMRLLVYAALAAGTRGICFESQSRLDATDVAARTRALGLELLNIELQVLEPWAAAGSAVSTVPGLVLNTQPSTGVAPRLYGAARSDAAHSGTTMPTVFQPEVSAAVIQTDRAQLLLPIWAATGAQYVPGQSAGNGIGFVVPGVPEANGVQEITPGGLRPTRHQRVAGGIRVLLDEFGMTSMVLLSQDPVVLNTVTQRLNQAGPRATQLGRELARKRFDAVSEIDARLAGAGHAAKLSAKWLTASRASLDACEAQLAVNDYLGAYVHARRALRPLNQLERAQWAEAIKVLPAPGASPLAATFATLPAQWQFAKRLETGSWGRNRLEEGVFEDLDRMVFSGWQHFEHPQEGVRTEAELSPDAPNQGHYSLRLAARAVDERAVAGLVETPPVWITSPGVPVAAGGWMRISGSVYVPEAIAGSLDGLMIMDSVGGETLAERVGETSGWRSFTMYRAMPQSGRLSLTIALTGFGEAWVDDVKIEPWLPPGTPREVIAPTDRAAMVRLPPVR